MPRILLLTTALIIYGSLYPWQFHAAPIPASPLWILLHSWPTQFNRFILKDIPVNLLMYVPFGTSAYLALRRAPLWLRLALPLAGAIALSGSMEMIQIYDAQRVCSLLDFATNVSGCVLGIALGTGIEGSGVALPALAPNGSAGLYLLLCWLAARTFPFMPDLSRAHLAAKWTLFRAAHLMPLEAAGSLLAWLVAWRMLVFALGEVNARTAGPWLLLVVPARFFIAGLTPTWVDAAVAVSAWLVWSGWLSHRRRVDLPLAAVLVAMITLHGLAPFDFASRAQEFWWVPFRSLAHTEWQTGFAVILEKVFLYGSTLWLCFAAGLPALFAVVSLVLLLAMIEAAQIYLPQHVAESTDPVLALLVGSLLMALRPRGPRARVRKRRKRRVASTPYDPASGATAPGTAPPRTSDS